MNYKLITNLQHDGKEYPFGSSVPQMDEAQLNSLIESGVVVDDRTFQQLESRTEYHMDSGSLESDARTKALQETVPVFRTKYAQQIQDDYMKATEANDRKRVTRASKHTEEDAADDQRSEELKKQTELPQAQQANEAARLKQMQEGSKSSK